MNHEYESPDLRAHFGFATLPFTREIEARKRYRPDGHEQALHQVRRSVEERMSAAVIGPAGAGKSVLLRALEEVLPKARYRTHYVHVTDLSARDMCREICRAMGCEPAGYYGALVGRVQARAHELMHSESLRPVLIVDEAHGIRPNVLKILRVLTNFEMDSRLVLSVVLAGQPSLRALLRRDDMDAVRGRIARYASLNLLSRAESQEYVTYRCEIVGSSGALFASDSHEALFEATQGNMRALDRLCLASLDQAARTKDKIVDASHVVSARALVQP